jgi:hypothetical protein
VNLNFFKNLILKKWFTSFGGFQPLSADRFIGLGTGLPIIPIGKLVILTDLPIFDFSNVKFKFRAIFDRFYEFSW